ncbi:hybrid sensor histidine kinase/response regulator [Mesoterricola silvestris]|uniref:histidine kinase n=1 Tax=Mesoterricola silvestris TaxID=2927979 RepID=A0AA48K9S3_9BACT|nr:hybrid sensor histidine kinase/response regulator [Mesoterricola silvestris]BDU72622.1 hypothetical protein METEAL_17960 [Mesoterricola silvestris]
MQESPASRILIVEDDRTWLAMVTRLFRNREPDCACLTATDLASALPLLATPGLDLVLLDLNLPDSHGLETLRRVRGANREASVVVMTADDDEGLAMETLRQGAQDCFVKGAGDGPTLLRVARYARERMATERRLRRSEELFQAISENMMDLLAIVDGRGRRTFTSPSYARILGYGPGEGFPTLEEAVHPDDLPGVLEALDRLIAQGSIPVLEFRLRHRDGSYRVLEARAARFGGSGPPQGLVVARDVTDRRQAEQERAALEVSLRQAQKLESVGQLASGIAHEINTPIQFVHMNLTLLKKSFASLTGLLDLYRGAAAPDPGLRAAEEAADLEYLRGELPKVLQESLDGVQRVARIVRAMKEFTHPGAKEPTILDVNRLAAGAATIARNEWKYVATLDLDLEEGLPAVRGHAAELSQAFLNLIVNAAHAIQARGGMGQITVSTRRAGELVEIRVRDTGTGIPPEHQARVFEPFYTTKGVGKGTGQGLTICYQNIVNLHGGKIFFETEPGAGTTFVIQLPGEA